MINKENLNKLTEEEMENVTGGVTSANDINNQGQSHNPGLSDPDIILKGTRGGNG